MSGRVREVTVFAVALAACVVAVSAPRDADCAGVGTTGANLLKLNMGSRGLALAGATCALPGDLAGLLSNPSLLSPLGTRSLMFTHWPGVAQMKTEFVSYSLPVGSLGLWAGTVLYRTLPDIDNEVPGEEPVPVNDGMIMMSFARRLGGAGRHAGVNVKLFNSAIGDVRATSVALDFGTIMQASKPFPFLYGFSLSNLGLPIRHERVGEMLPVALRGGVSWSRLIYPHSLNVAADVSVNAEQDARGAAGVEWVQGGHLGLRAGASWSRYAGANYSLGVGWQLRSTVLGPEAEYHLDYAYVPFAFLSAYQPTHVFSVFVRF